MASIDRYGSDRGNRQTETGKIRTQVIGFKPAAQFDNSDTLPAPVSRWKSIELS
jgi:hypothetical protein